MLENGLGCLFLLVRRVAVLAEDALHGARISLLSSFRSYSTARFFCGMCLTSARNSSDRMEMSGFFNPAAAKMSTTSSLATAREIICRMA